MKYFCFYCFRLRCFLHNAKGFTHIYFYKIFSDKSFNLKVGFFFFFIADCLYHFINLHYANPGVLASVLQEKSEVYFICWYAKLLFFPCLFTESNTAILAIKYLCVTGSKRGKRLCSEVLKMRLIFSNWLICYEHTKALQIDMVNLDKRI